MSYQIIGKLNSEKYKKDDILYPNRFITGIQVCLILKNQSK